MKIFEYETEKSFDYENGFYLTSDIARFSKALAQYELYKQIVSLPGQVVELGVFKGASLVRWATFRDLLESPTSRKVIGFDAFGAFPRPRDDPPGKEWAEFHDKAAGTGISKAELEACFTHKKLSNVELVAGDIFETLPKYIEAHPELRVAFLHVDVDVYAPSKFTLEQLYDRVVPDGIIAFDDYAMIAGETDAADEFLAGKGLQLEKLPIAHIPTFVRKPR